jgi:hypothetical protein
MLGFAVAVSVAVVVALYSVSLVPVSNADAKQEIRRNIRGAVIYTAILLALMLLGYIVQRWL